MKPKQVTIKEQPTVVERIIRHPRIEDGRAGNLGHALFAAAQKARNSKRQELVL